MLSVEEIARAIALDDEKTIKKALEQDPTGKLVFDALHYEEGILIEMAEEIKGGENA